MGEQETPKALVDGVPTELVFVSDGYMAPSTFQVRKDLRDGLVVTIDADIVEAKGRKHVIPRRVVIEDPEGVSSIALRQVQVREWVAEELMHLLRHPRFQPDGTMRLDLISESEIDEAREICLRLVGYARQVTGRQFHKLAERPQEPPS